MIYDNYTFLRGFIILLYNKTISYVNFIKHTAKTCIIFSDTLLELDVPLYMLQYSIVKVFTYNGISR